MNPGSQRGIKLAMAALALVGLVGLAVALVVLRLPPFLVLLLAVGGIVLPILALRPEVGLHLFIPLILIENFGAADQGITVGKVAGVGIISSWLLNLAVTRRFNLRMNAQIVALLAFLCCAALSVLVAEDSGVAFVRTLTYAQLLLAMLMFGSVLDSPAAITRLMRGLVAWTTLAAIHGLALYGMGIARTSAGVAVNRNTMAVYLTFTIVCAYLLYQASSSALERLMLTAALPILFVADALTFSRGGLIALGIVIVLLVYRLARQHGFVILGTTVIMFVLIGIGLPGEFYERVESIAPTLRRQEDTFGMRVELIKAGTNIIAAHPVLGIGAGNFPLVARHYSRSGFLMSAQRASHNTYVGVASESGLPALAAFLLGIGAAWRTARAIARDTKLRYPSLALSAMAAEMSLVVFMVCGLSSDEQSSKFMYIFLGIILAMDRIHRRLMASPAPVPERADAQPVDAAVLAVP